MERVDSALPPIPAKRYFTIGEVSELCLVKPYVLRYWEQEFVQLKPMKRRGNRRYYQHHEVLLIRRIRELLYEQGFTISGARNQLADMGVVLPSHDEADDDLPLDGEGGATGLMSGRGSARGGEQAAMRAPMPTAGSVDARSDGRISARALQASGAPAVSDLAWMGPDLPDLNRLSRQSVASLREALLSIRDLLS
jgi:DNA-binding transcriptional MerR regulator